jgi:hypothetical protein
LDKDHSSGKEVSVVHNVERNLVVVLLEPVQLASALSGEGATVIPIGGAQVGGAQERFKPEDGWGLISHTLTFGDDGSAILSLLFERYTLNPVNGAS